MTEISGLSFSPPSDLNDGAHNLFVREKNILGVWTSASSFVITVDATGPAMPTVTGPAVTQLMQPTWTWVSGGSGGSGAFRYKLGDADLTVGATSTATLAYTPTSSLSDGAYTLYVQESDALGNWSASGSFQITVNNSQPTAPTTLITEDTLNLGDVRYDDDTSIVFRWSAGTHAVGILNYTVDRYAQALCAGAPTTTTGVTGASLAVTGAATVTYSFKVTAIALNGISAQSACSGSILIDVTTPLGATALVTEDTLNAGDVRTDDDGTVHFRWTLGSDAESGSRDYTLLRYDLAACAGSSTNTYSNSNATTSQQWVGLEGKTYSFRVKAYNRAGLFTVSDCSGSIAVNALPPPNLSSVTFVQGSEIGNVGITMTMPADVSDYKSRKIYRIAGSTAPSSDCVTGSLISTSSYFVNHTFFDNSGTPGEQYSYRICLEDFAGTINGFHTGTATAKPYEVFITGANYTGDMRMNLNGESFARGLDGADYRCQQAATNAGRSGYWRAILSDSATNASSRFILEAPLYSTNGTQIAVGKTALLNGTALSSAISWNESGGFISSPPIKSWSGSLSNGTKSATVCDDWKSASSGFFGTYGENTYTDAQWINSSTISCSTPASLACISQKVPGLRKFKGQPGLASGVIKISWDFPTIGGFGADSIYGSVQIRELAGTTPPNENCTDGDGSAVVHTISDASYTAGFLTLSRTAGNLYSYRACIYSEANALQTSHALANPVISMNGKTLFVTSTATNGNLGGLAGADSLCAAAATAAGATGVTWRALISNGSVSAATRTSSSLPFYSSTGELLASTAADFFDGGLPVRIKTELQTVLPSTPKVWNNFDTTGAINTANHCLEWTSSSSGDFGKAADDDNVSSSTWSTSNGSIPCSTSAHLYCVSQ